MMFLQPLLDLAAENKMRSLGFMVEVFATLETILKCLEVITSEKKPHAKPESLAPLTCQFKLDSKPAAKPKTKPLFLESSSAVSSPRATSKLALLATL